MKYIEPTPVVGRAYTLAMEADELYEVKGWPSGVSNQFGDIATLILWEASAEGSIYVVDTTSTASTTPTNRRAVPTAILPFAVPVWHLPRLMLSTDALEGQQLRFEFLPRWKSRTLEEFILAIGRRP